MKKCYKYLTTCSTKYDRGKTITMLSLYYHELMRKIKEHKGKNT